MYACVNTVIYFLVWEGEMSQSTLEIVYTNKSICNFVVLKHKHSNYIKVGSPI